MSDNKYGWTSIGFAPGSDEAIEAGCTCPVMDNAHGRGRWGNGPDYGWWMASSCPIHGELVPDIEGGRRD